MDEATLYEPTILSLEYCPICKFTWTVMLNDLERLAHLLFHVVWESSVSALAHDLEAAGVVPSGGDEQSDG